MDDLNSQRWERVREALGGCDLATLVRDLCSEDDDVFGGAWTTLHMAVIGYDCEGPYVEEAAALVIPFIAALLSYEPIQWKHGLLSILAETDCDRFVEYKHLAERHASLRFSVPRPGADEDPVRVALRAGLDTYLVLLGDLDPQVRSGAACLLAILPEAADRSGALLISMVRADPEPDVRAAVADALGRLFGRDLAVRELLAERLRLDGDELVRLVCAQMLAEGAEGQAPVEALGILASALDDPDGLLSRYASDMPYGQRDALSYISHAISRLAPRDAAMAIPVLIASLARIELYWQGECIVQALLHAAFGDVASDEGSAIHARTDAQRRLLEAVVASEPLWSKVDERDMGDELERHGLPRTRAGLLGLLAAPPNV